MPSTPNPVQDASATTLAAALKCEMSSTCTAPVTHLDAKGYTYCTDHGQARQMSQRCRKLRPHELRKLERGQVLSSY
jgi:hypothetical protein